jgi:hypothetical protein
MRSGFSALKNGDSGNGSGNVTTSVAECILTTILGN